MNPNGHESSGATTTIQMCPDTGTNAHRDKITREGIPDSDASTDIACGLSRFAGGPRGFFASGIPLGGACAPLGPLWGSLWGSPGLPLGVLVRPLGWLFRLKSFLVRVCVDKSRLHFIHPPPSNVRFSRMGVPWALWDAPMGIPMGLVGSWVWTHLDCRRRCFRCRRLGSFSVFFYQFGSILRSSWGGACPWRLGSSVDTVAEDRLQSLQPG